MHEQGFKKIAAKRWEFHHEKFQKGCRHLLLEIVRKKCEPSIFPAYLKASEAKNMVSAASEKYNDDDRLQLMAENEKLRRENLKMEIEIAHLKTLETKLLNWLSQYMSNNKNKVMRLC